MFFGGFVMNRLFFLVVAVVLSGCAATPEWVSQPTFSLSVRLHEGQGVGSLDNDGVCNLFLPFNEEAEKKDLNPEINACVKQRAGKGFAQTSDRSVKHFKFYPMQFSHQVGQRIFDLTKEKVPLGEMVCTTDDCGHLGSLFQGDGWCGLIYMPTYTYRNGRKYDGTLAHELLHGFIGRFHRTDSRYWEWLPREKWRPGKVCG